MTGRPELPTVEPDRVDQMRSHLMKAIADDARAEIQRRGPRRARWVLAGAAAAAVVVIGGAVVNDAVMRPGQSADSSGQSAGSSADVALRDEMAEPDAAKGYSSGSPIEGEPLHTVVTTGSMSLAVDDVEDAVADIDTFVGARGGRLDGETTDSDGDRTWSDVTVRVPERDLPALRRELAELGTVSAVSVSREQVGSQYRDIEARITSLEASIRRLRSIIAEAGTTKDLLDAESTLSKRQGDLESLKAQRRVLANQTALATIQVSISQSEAAQTVAPSGFVGGLTRGWNSLVATTNAVVTGLGVLIPWLVPLGAAGAVALVARRRLQAR